MNHVEQLDLETEINMYLEDILRRTNFDNLSRDELIYICFVLQDEVKKLQSINKQKITKEYHELNKSRSEYSNLLNKYNEANKMKNALLKKLNIPLTLKERLNGKLDIKKLNKPDNISDK